MHLNNIRLLVKDFDTCFTFYSEKLGLDVTWGKPGSAFQGSGRQPDRNIFRITQGSME